MPDTTELLVLDGGMSRELMRIGAPFKQPEWSAQALIEAPHMVQQVHEGFATAGADMITTNSYALVPFHIGEERFQSSARELASLSGKLARDAAEKVGKAIDRKILVAGSLPPIFGSYRPDLFDATQVRKYLSVLIDGLTPWIDVWLGETLSLIAEAEAVVAAVKDSNKPWWLSFTVEDEKNDLEGPARLRSGEPVSDAVRVATELGAKAVLFNCSRPEYMKRAIEDAGTTLSELGANVRIGVYANAFEPKPDGYAANAGIAPVRKDLNEDVYRKFAQQWVSCGATIVGGCCGIGCDVIAQVAESLKPQV